MEKIVNTRVGIVLMEMYVTTWMARALMDALQDTSESNVKKVVISKYYLNDFYLEQHGTHQDIKVIFSVCNCF